MLAVLAEHELLGDHLGLCVKVVEPLGVRHGLVAADDVLPAHHDAVGRGVDEPLDAGRLRRAYQVLGALDVDGEAALPVLLGHRGAAHEVDDGRGVEDGVDVFDRRGDGFRIADVAPSTSRPAWSGRGDGARSNERTAYPRSSSSVTRLAPTKPEPPVTRTRPSSVVRDASRMRSSITETRSSFDYVWWNRLPSQSSSPSRAASACSTR